MAGSHVVRVLRRSSNACSTKATARSASIRRAMANRKARATILDYLAISEALHERHGDFEAIVGHSFGVLCGFVALAEGVHARCAVAVSGVSEFRYLFDAFSAELRLSDALKRALRTRIE